MKIDGTRRNDRATELVLAYYAAFNRGDHAAMLACLDEQVLHDPHPGLRQNGHATFAAFLQQRARCHREKLVDIVVMSSPDGARAAAEYVVHGEYLADDVDPSASATQALPKANGQTYQLPGGAFFEVRDGRIARISSYCNLREWLAQSASDAAG